MNDQEKLTAAIKAVNHVLHRICDDPATALVLGHGTESYVLLCEAMAAYKEIPAADVMETWEPARPKPLTSAPMMTERSSTLPTLAIQLCEELSVAPLVATEIIAHAQSNDLELEAYPITGDTHETDTWRAWFCRLAHDAFIHWADAQLLAA